MSNSQEFHSLITKIHAKLMPYQKGNNNLTKKEVEDFIFFLRKGN